MGAKTRLGQVTLALAAVLIAGCGTVRATGPGNGGTPTPTRQSGPPWSTRSAALGLARQLLAQSPLPPGARRLPQHPVPPSLRLGTTMPGVVSTVDSYRLYALPVSMRSAATFLSSHVPAGMQSGGPGQSGYRGHVTEQNVSFIPKKTPWGISSAELTGTVVPAPHGGSLLRVDAQVTWYPRRTAAEHLVPANYRAVTIDGWLSGRTTRHVARTFSSPAVIARLTRLLNGLPAFPGGLFPCPLELAQYRLTFEAVAGHPDVVVTTSGCASDGVSVGGVTQPALADATGLLTLVNKIMNVHPSLRAQA